MLIKKLPHLLLTLLVAVVIGCASSNPLADDAQSNIESQNYQAALESAEKSIEKYPGDPIGYYYKGVALGELAGEKDDPKEAQKLYKQMNDTFDKAKDVASKAEKVPGEMDRIPAIKNVLWQQEHNRAIELIRSDSLKKVVDQPMEKSMERLQNATIIQPDSSLSWNVLSQVAAMNKNFEQAVKAKNKYMSMIPDTAAKPDDYMQMASYYYNMDQQEKLVEVLEKAQKQYPNNEDIVSNLADAYNRTGRPDKAISTVEQLVERDPKNPQYHLVLGTQIYQKALRIGDTLATNSDKIISLRKKMNDASSSEQDQIEQEISKLNQQNEEYQQQISELTDRAEEELKTTIEYRPNDADAYNTLGVIYQNKAKAIFDQRNRTTDNEEASKLDKKGKDYLKQSMNYYEKATEIKPEEKSYWQSLFQIYTALGMDKKAQEAMEKAGMN